MIHRIHRCWKPVKTSTADFSRPPSSVTSLCPCRLGAWPRRPGFGGFGGFGFWKHVFCQIGKTVDMRRFSPWLKMIRYGSEWFQLWYQDICSVTLAAGPTLEFRFFPKRAQMPQMMSMMMLIWGMTLIVNAHGWRSPYHPCLIHLRRGKRTIDIPQLCIKKCYDPQVKWKRTSSKSGRKSSDGTSVPRHV